MNLSDYLRVIRKRKFIVILCFILIVASTVYYTKKQTPVYSTSCRVRIEQRKSVTELLTELVAWSPGDPVASQANLIKSYQIMERVAETLEVISSNMESSVRLSKIKALQGQVSTERVGYTNVITIIVESSDPEQAMMLANTVANVYVDMHFENKIREASNVKNFVDVQVQSYYEDLLESENALQSFLQENPMVADRYNEITPTAKTDPRVSSLNEEIVNTEMEIISLKSKYTDNHPEVIEQNRRLERTKKDLADTVAQMTSQQKTLSTKEIELAQLRRNISIAEEMYMDYKKRQAAAYVLEAEKARDATVVEPAAQPSSPIKPSLRMNVMIGVLAGLLIGLIMGFIVESMDTTIGRIDDIEELINIPVIGLIPHYSPHKLSKKTKFRRRGTSIQADKKAAISRLVTLFEPTSIMAEAYRSLRTQLDYSGLKKEGQSVLVTSASPGEGKTQTLINIAGAYAQEGKKVLIIDTDFRKPIISEIFDVNRTPGLSEVLIGKVSLDQAINTFADMLLAGHEFDQVIKARGLENLNILTSGGHTPNPAELLSFVEMDLLIAELKQKFDIVLFDSPPVLPVTDASILSTKMDGVLFVYQAGKTPRQALVRAKMQLENVKAHIWGVIINNVKAEYLHDVSGYTHYQYYSSHKKNKK